MKQHILKALEKRYEAQICEAESTIKIYFNNSVGIGEHPDVLEAIEKEIAVIATYMDELEVLNRYFPE